MNIKEITKITSLDNNIKEKSKFRRIKRKHYSNSYNFNLTCYIFNGSCKY